MATTDRPRRPCEGRCAARAPGFTLIELIVVMVIAVLLLSLVPPMLSGGVSSAELKGAARRLAAGLRLARSYAIAQHQETVLTVDVEGKRFQVTGDPRIHSLPEGLEVKLFTAQSELSNESTGAIRFFPDGSSTGGRITLAHGERKYEVDVNWLTGRVAIFE